METLLLITCCKSKRPGGEVRFQPATFLSDHLSKPAYSKLMTLRSDLGGIMGYPEGPDLGGRLSDGNLLYMPAYKRYVGRMYTVSKLEEGYQEKEAGIDVLIISALYGLLHPNDLIRDYELRMSDPIPMKGRVGNWWSNHGLREILIEMIKNLGVNVCHDLLSMSYRDVISPWPPDSLAEMIAVYDFPGQGIGSLYRRGAIIKDVLEGKAS